MTEKGKTRWGYFLHHFTLVMFYIFTLCRDDTEKSIFLPSHFLYEKADINTTVNVYKYVICNRHTFYRFLSRHYTGTQSQIPRLQYMNIDQRTMPLRHKVFAKDAKEKGDVTSFETKIDFIGIMWNWKTGKKQK